MRLSRSGRVQRHPVRQMLTAATALVAMTLLFPSPLLQPAAATFPATPTLDDYWNGRADWHLDKFWSQADYGYGTDAADQKNDGGFGRGSNIVIGPDGVWNWFYGTSHFDSHNSCTNNDNDFTVAGTLLRRSTDRGATWSPPSIVVLPAPDKVNWKCQAVDGDAVWDGTQWHYFFQCTTSVAGASSPWHGCHVTNNSANPTAGTWVEDPLDPVMGDEIKDPDGNDTNPWKAICDQPTDDCVDIPNGPGRVGATGTFSTFETPADPGWFYIDFHGVDTSFGYQYTGVAKTQDWHRFRAGSGFNLPVDAIYDRLDAVNWREPAPNWNQTTTTNGGEEIGGGGGAVFYDPNDGRYYHLEEASDGAVCTQAPVFDFGILRSSSLTNTTWSQPAIAGRENPIQYSQTLLWSDENIPARCSPSYESLFNDPSTGETYMLLYKRSGPNVQGVYLFKLEYQLLANGDAWRCVSVDPFQLSTGGTDEAKLRIWRDGNWASDGGCYLAFSQDISQTVALPASRPYTKVVYGGKYATRSSLPLVAPMGYQSSPATGTVQVVLQQLNSLGVVISTSTLNVAATGNYPAARATSTVCLLASTTQLRYTVKVPPLSGLAVLADEMVVKPA